ncbi:Glucosamine-6-phosphate isomerase (Glucosamine-6-phosphate deaminase) (GNPDA) (GlcN6P deaminase) [Marasmius sp. AFHP31]|nr:Glucosamine-6-phosphate isomerase (Glucosamine-6-phosphate deaminase) (GNPDA) (GlcN6P deaminase) [Marasmius sp. AFHP31]
MKNPSGLTLALADISPVIRPTATEATEDLHAGDESDTLTVLDDGSDIVPQANSSLSPFRGLTSCGTIWMVQRTRLWLQLRSRRIRLYTVIEVSIRTLRGTKQKAYTFNPLTNVSSSLKTSHPLVVSNCTGLNNPATRSQLRQGLLDRFYSPRRNG